ncbi:MAG: non-canonical purine NTP diphosphatase [Bacteroidetes bacterium]|jgi:XTP/dITP diphosphohydrolase|nr:non-canonical purine NTP diphosphatase [Bacteroidota bacterium]MBT6688082.1 non-canonical purine NTP diphosphatase [Bacteroidota bacterium]MBT7142335.1 non-canonical purine NTP diphosphatase [Bacteroidota bacterium]MBT7491149.1 non-canonical purine NTP diphosphatase [Bacteroidota bacterium]
MKLIFATNNQHKLQEVKKAIGSEFEIISLKELNFFDEIPETHETIEENAREKSFFIYNKFKTNCFADDTGLEIEALNGNPGVYSARYAGENCTFDDNMNKVLKELSGIKNRNAFFKTVVSLIIDGNEVQFLGLVKGKILEHKTGKSGFGYDPIFQPDGFAMSFAEMPLKQKNQISHRGLAVKKLPDYLKNFQLPV